MSGWGVRARLTAAVTLSFALALSLGAVLLLRAVEQTVLADAEQADRQALARIGEQIERGVPLDGLLAPPGVPGSFFLRGGALPPPPPLLVAPTVWLFAVQAAPSLPPLWLAALPPPVPPPPFLPWGPVPLQQRAPEPVCAEDVLAVRSEPPPFEDPGFAVVHEQLRQPDGRPLELYAARSLAELRRSTDSLARVLWFGIPALLVLIAITAWVVIGRALSPIAAMTRQVERIEASSLHARVPEPEVHDEIGELARMLNRMLGRLQAAAESQRQFVANASHELRSPVATIRAQLEVALAHPRDVDWPALARELLAEDRRLEALVADLLLLARLDEQAEPPRAEVDVEDLVIEECGRPRQVPVELAAIEPARVLGSATQLRCVIRNLLDNAARHAHARVLAGIERTREGLVIRVDDDGPGIAAGDRERVFERFVRLEQGRGRDSGGVGLGLSLVRRIATLHGGSVHVGDAPLGGARLEVRLPTGDAGPLAERSVDQPPR